MRLSPARASSVSRLLSSSWDEQNDYPTISQCGDFVLIEGGWRSLGWAANTLAMDGRFHVVSGGQWLSETHFNAWLEVHHIGGTDV